MLLFCGSSWAGEYRCKEHEHFLLLEEHGFEHVNHNLLLNGKTLIKELADTMWFIEEVECAASGFEVTASHIQYNEPTKKEFTIRVIGLGKYEIR